LALKSGADTGPDNDIKSPEEEAGLNPTSKPFLSSLFGDDSRGPKTAFKDGLDFDGGEDTRELGLGVLVWLVPN
jgi:hypothetical protein